MKSPSASVGEPGGWVEAGLVGLAGADGFGHLVVDFVNRVFADVAAIFAVLVGCADDILAFGRAEKVARTLCGNIGNVLLHAITLNSLELICVYWLVQPHRQYEE